MVLNYVKTVWRKNTHEKTFSDHSSGFVVEWER
jgi:hypothetical protein